MKHPLRVSRFSKFSVVSVNKKITVFRSLFMLNVSFIFIKKFTIDKSNSYDSKVVSLAKVIIRKIAKIRVIDILRAKFEIFVT